MTSWFVSVIKVDDAADNETLEGISDWFKTGHNVAVMQSKSNLIPENFSVPYF